MSHDKARDDHWWIMAGLAVIGATCAIFWGLTTNELLVVVKERDALRAANESVFKSAGTQDVDADIGAAQGPLPRTPVVPAPAIDPEQVELDREFAASTARLAEREALVAEFQRTGFVRGLKASMPWLEITPEESEYLIAHAPQWLVRGDEFEQAYAYLGRERIWQATANDAAARIKFIREWIDPHDLADLLGLPWATVDAALPATPAGLELPEKK